MANKTMSSSSTIKIPRGGGFANRLQLRNFVPIALFYAISIIQNSLCMGQSQLLNMLPFLEVMDFNLEIKDMLLLNKLFNTQCQNVVNGQVNQPPGGFANNVLEVNTGAGGGLSSAAAQPLTTSITGQRTDSNSQSSSSNGFDPSSLASAFGFSEAAFGSNSGPFSFLMQSGGSSNNRNNNNNNNNNNNGGSEPSVYNPDAAAHDLSPTVMTFIHNFKKQVGANSEKTNNGDAWSPPSKKNFIFTDSKGRNLAEKLILSSTLAPTTKNTRPPQRFAKQQPQPPAAAVKQRQKQRKAAVAAQAAASAAEKEDFGPPPPTTKPKAKAVPVSNHLAKNNNNQNNAFRAMRAAASRAQAGTQVRLVRLDRTS